MTSASQPAPADAAPQSPLSARPRPLLPIALALAGGILLEQTLVPATPGLSAAFAAGGILSALAAGLATRRHGTPGWMLTVWLLAAAAAAGYVRAGAGTARGPAHIARRLEREPFLTRIAGRVVSRPIFTPARRRNPFLPYEPSPRTRFLLAAQAWRAGLRPVAAEGLIQVYVKGQVRELAIGDEVIVTGRLYRIPGPRNPGETDWARWARLQGIDAGLSVESPGLVRQARGPTSVLRRLLNRVRGGARGLLCDAVAGDPEDRTARLLDTMVLGNRSAAGRDLNEAFLRTGTVHFLAVSGFHVGVLAGAVWWIVRRILRRGRRAAAAVTLIVLVAYALLVEPRAPVFRAATMGVVLCVGHLLRRPVCVLNWLALAAVCILLASPLELFRPGFQLSFVQVLAIVTLFTPAYVRLTRRTDADGLPTDADTRGGLLWRIVWRATVGLVLVCVTAWAVSLPLVLLHFGRFAPLGALQSVLISPLVVVTVVLGFAALATAPVPLLGSATGTAAASAGRVLLWVVDRLGRLPDSLIETVPPPVWLVAATYGAALAAWLWWRRRPPAEESPRGRLIRRAVPVALGMAIAGGWLGWVFRPPALAGQCVVVVLSVGSGSANVIRTPDHHAAVFDAGTIHNTDAGAIVLACLRTLGVCRLDALAVSHANFDHYSGVPAILGQFPATPLLTNPWFAARASEDAAVRKLLAMLPDGTPRQTLWAAQPLAVGNLDVQVLWPPAGEPPAAVNDRSLVVRLRARGHSVLLTGDIGREAEAGLLDAAAAGRIDLRADVLIAPHHGAVVATSPAFYAAVSPRVVINSSNRDRPRLRKLLAGLPAPPRLLNTHRVGAVRVRITPAGALRVETPLAPPADALGDLDSRPTRTRSVRAVPSR